MKGLWEINNKCEKFIQKVIEWHNGTSQYICVQFFFTSNHLYSIKPVSNIIKFEEALDSTVIGSVVLRAATTSAIQWRHRQDKTRASRPYWAIGIIKRRSRGWCRCCWVFGKSRVRISDRRPDTLIYFHGLPWNLQEKPSVGHKQFTTSPLTKILE